MNKMNLFTPLALGALSLPNRIIMAPLTRMRAIADGVPTTLMAEYYAQRSSAGLIITEATAIGANAHGYPQMPGIYSKDQLEGWRRVTDEVHRKGGRISLQIVHHGRWSHSSYNADGSLPVAPSAIAPSGNAFNPEFQQVPFEVPRALEANEIPQIVDLFWQAARNGLTAGFDAIEIHGANGFLIDQFLQDGSNNRHDEFGGSIENRAKLLLSVVDAVSDVVGSERTGVRLSPHGNLGGISDSDPVGHFKQAIAWLSTRRLAYLHLIEPRASSIGLGDDASIDSANNVRLFRSTFSGPIITAGGYNAESASSTLAANLADAVAFGRMFIANPDLPERIRVGAPLNKFDRSTAYGGGSHGYTDYDYLENAET